MDLNIGIIIPVRFESGRFPGKPLIDIFGKTMVQRTWERSIMALPQDQVYIATDDERIFKHVESFGAQAIMTSVDCLTGTDRLAEANLKLDLDIVINVQGDEPIIDPDDIKKVIDFSLANPSAIINAYSKIKEEKEFRSLTVPKVVKSIDNKLLYMSRAALPGSKANKFYFGFKQICIYAFPKQALQSFAKNAQKSPFEMIEDIEILRFLENGFEVMMVEVEGNSLAVDVEEDLEIVKKRLINETK